MKRMDWNWLRAGILFVTVAFAFQQPVVPADAYWFYQDFSTPQGSQTRIAADIGALEWNVDQTYEVNIVIYARNFGANVSRFYSISVECEWVFSGTNATEVTENPPELIRGQSSKTIVPFTFYHGESGNEALYYRINFTEGTSDGTDTPWSSGWQKAFAIQVKAPAPASKDDYQYDSLLIGAIVVALGALCWAALATFRIFRRPKPRRRKKLLAGWMKTCQICELLNDFDAVFCKRCGAQL